MVVDDDFEALFREVFPKLVSLGTLKTGRSDIAHELAQETMTRAHARWNDVSGYDAPAAWCRTVMVNLLIDHHRSASAEGRAIDRLDGSPDAPLSTPGPALSGWNRLVAPLTDRQRTIITLYYADDLSVGQIAQLLDTSRAAIKAALFKARRTMRRALEAEGDDDA